MNKTTISLLIAAGLFPASARAQIIAVPLPAAFPVLATPVIVPVSSPRLIRNDFPLPIPVLPGVPAYTLPGAPTPVIRPGVPVLRLTGPVAPVPVVVPSSPRAIERAIERVDGAFHREPLKRQTPSWTGLSAAFDGTQTLPEDDLMKELGF